MHIRPFKPIFLIFYFVSVIFVAFLIIQTPYRISDQSDILDALNFDCQAMLEENYTGTLMEFKFDSRKIEDDLLYSTDRCSKVKKLFQFHENPLSQEESDFPLAYGILAYKETIQFLFMLSAFYHPQNQYCIAVGTNSPDSFKYLIKELTNCWPNVYFLDRPKISWGSHEIINSVYTCLEFLSHLKSDWKYFQYLSGVDVPLKSNLEMVRILKALNSSANFQIKDYDKNRLNGRKIGDSPLPLYKSSLSALIPRKAANSMASSNVARNVLKFLEGTKIADESFWGTILGNQDKFDIEGSIDGKKWIDFKKSKNETGKPIEMRYYISRYQLWKDSKETCGGKYTSGSCVFGVRDVSALMKLPNLVAHKFYISYQPAALFCTLKEIRRRSQNPTISLNTSKYANLPQVQLKRGLRIEELDRDVLT